MNAASYGHTLGLWEMALILFKEDGDWGIVYERDFDDDVKGYLTSAGVIKFLKRIKQY